MGRRQEGRLKKSGKQNEPLAELLVRIAARDQEAFAELYKKAGAKLFGIIIRITGQGGASEDVLQECFVTIWKRAGSYDPDIASPISWMAVIARNKAIDFKRLKAEKLSSDSVELDEKLPSTGADPEQEASRSEELRALMSCLEGLKPEHREMILLAYVKGWSRAELGEKFMHPVATIKTYLRRGLAQLKGCLDG